jgi:hypothetical protein
MTAPETWLRVVIYEIRGADDYDESLAYLTSSLAGFTRVLEAQPGFVVAFWGHDADTGTVAAVSHWRSRQAIRDADAELLKLQAGALAHGIEVVHVQNLELFPIPVSMSMWTDADGADKVPGARSRLRFRLQH